VKGLFAFSDISLWVNGHERILGVRRTRIARLLSPLYKSPIFYLFSEQKFNREDQNKTKTEKKKREVQRNLPIITMRLTSLKADRQTLAGRTARPGWREKKQTNKRRGRKIMSPPLVDVSVGRDQNRNNGNSPAHLGGKEEKKKAAAANELFHLSFLKIVCRHFR
jgi:hypothetical protein